MISARLSVIAILAMVAMFSSPADANLPRLSAAKLRSLPTWQRQTLENIQAKLAALTALLDKAEEVAECNVKREAKIAEAAGLVATAKACNAPKFNPKSYDPKEYYPEDYKPKARKPRYYGKRKYLRACSGLPRAKKMARRYSRKRGRKAKKMAKKWTNKVRKARKACAYLDDMEYSYRQTIINTAGDPFTVDDVNSPVLVYPTITVTKPYCPSIEAAEGAYLVAKTAKCPAPVDTPIFALKAEIAQLQAELAALIAQGLLPTVSAVARPVRI